MNKIITILEQLMYLNLVPKGQVLLNIKYKGGKSPFSVLLKLSALVDLLSPFSMLINILCCALLKQPTRLVYFQY